MSGSASESAFESSESAVGDAPATKYERAPWWAWGFAAAVPFGVLALVTPWFEGVPPANADVYGSRAPVDYYAWTFARLGVVCPIFLIMVGCQWYGARRGWSRPPSPGDWYRARRAFSGYMAGGRVRGGGGDPRPEEPWYPFRTGAWCSIVVGVGAAVVLGINRAGFSATYAVEYTASSNFYADHNMIIRPAFGFWCYLIAVVLLVVTGIFGVCQRVRPWWVTGESDA